VIGGAGWRKDFGDKEGIWSGLADSLEKGEGFGPMMAALTPKGRPLPTEEQVAAMSALIAARNDLQALAAVIRGMRESMVTEEQLRANKVPALSIIGGIDPLKADADALKEVMSNLEVVVIEGADHPGCISSPKFRESMLEFLAEHSRRAVDSRR
jgi:pimeloyl-ACP methyl ester carboxylesterase